MGFDAGNNMDAGRGAVLEGGGGESAGIRLFATVVRRIEICMKGLIDSGVQVICDFGIRISDFGMRKIS